MEKKSFQKVWRQLLVPEMTINAILIEERMVRVFCFDKKMRGVTKVGKYALPPNIIKEGIIVRPQELKIFFQALRQKLWPKEKNVWVMLSLPSANFYIDIFSLPELEDQRFKEAVLFNAQMISPLPLEEAYLDWEDLGPSNKENEREIFVAVGIKKQIDSYIAILEEAGFKIVTIEPWALSLVRSFSYFGEKTQAVLSITLRPEGFEFVLSEDNKMIYFDFDSWTEIFGNKIPQMIPFEALKKHLENEIPILINYYSLKRQQPIKKFIFIGSDNRLNEAFKKFIMETFNLEPFNITLPIYMRRTTLDWLPVIGAALRGTIPREEDTIVSLAPADSEEYYFQYFLYRVASLWSKIVLTVFMVITGVFAIFDLTLVKNANKQYLNFINQPLNQSVINREKELLSKADEFNNLVDIYSKVTRLKGEATQILSLIVSSANENRITIKRVLMSTLPSTNITIQGTALNKEGVLSWKKYLDNLNKFQSVTLPLETILETPSGVSFTLNVKI